VIVTAYFDPPETVLQNMLLVAVPVNFVLIFANLRFAAAVAFLIAALGLDALAIFLRTDIPSAAKAFPIGFMLALCGPTLFAVFSLERASRRNYLHALLQKLQIDDLAAENDVLAQISATDALTGIANRRQLDKELNMFCGQADPKGAVMLIDIDEFKVFNDQHGHLAGDIALRELASCLSQHLRRCDSLARYGGEEFAVVMPEVASHEAMEAAQRMRRAVECHSFEISGVPRRVTVSIGVADAAQYPDPTVLIGAADAALYTAKKTGRNRVCASWLQPVICQAV
jgi:diguanylate cyclase (GGDEF)-like protein